MQHIFVKNILCGMRYVSMERRCVHVLCKVILGLYFMVDEFINICGVLWEFGDNFIYSGGYINVSS